MLQEKQNNLSRRLDELSADTSAPLLNTTAAWEKLELHLRKKPARVKPLWYAVAACLLLALAAPILIKKSNTVISTPPVAKKVQAAVSNPVDTATVKDFLPVINTKYFTAKDNKISPAKKELAASIKKETFPLPDSVAFVKVPDVKMITALPDTAPVSLAVAPKTKMRIVHLNELAEDDKTVSKNIAKIKAAKGRSAKTPKEEFAGVLRFRIYLKN